MRTALVRDGDRILVPPLVLFAVYLLLAGHNRPGGGFVAGLTIGAAVVLRAQARGAGEAMRLLPLSPLSTAASGLLLAALVALAPLAAGGGVLDQPFVERTWPLFGPVKLTSALVFDVGVALLVMGVVAVFVRAFDDAAGEAADVDPVVMGDVPHDGVPPAPGAEAPPQPGEGDDRAVEGDPGGVAP